MISNRGDVARCLNDELKSGPNFLKQNRGKKRYFGYFYVPGLKKKGRLLCFTAIFFLET